MIEKIISSFLFIDRWLNKITGGHPKATISARCGFFSIYGKRYWVFCASIIDWAFRPIDGRSHCLKAYRWELGIMPQKEFGKGSDFLRLLLVHIILASCPAIAIILRVAVLFNPDIRHGEY